MAFTADSFISNMKRRKGYSGLHVWLFYKLTRGTAWCAGEISYTFNKIGAKSKWYGGRPVFYVPYAQEWMSKNWECVYNGKLRRGSFKNIRKGDIVIFSWGNWSRDHIGAARGSSYKSNGNWYIPTIEGNTSGGIVDEKERHKKYIYAVYRPPYTKKKIKPATKKKGQKYPGKFPKLPSRGYFKQGDKGKEVERMQQFLGWALNIIIDIDGKFGPKTEKAVKAFEKKVKISPDGYFGKICLTAAKKFRR